MDRFRLKNIIILILLLLNGFLLFSLSQRRTMQRDAFRRTAEQLVALFEEDGMALDGGAISQAAPLGGAALVRDAAQEERAAAFLLGEALSSSDQGGGIFHYAGAAGEALFRSSGGFEAAGTLAERGVEDFCLDFCKEFSYTPPRHFAGQRGQRRLHRRHGVRQAPGFQFYGDVYRGTGRSHRCQRHAAAQDRNLRFGGSGAPLRRRGPAGLSEDAAGERGGGFHSDGYPALLRAPDLGDHHVPGSGVAGRHRHGGLLCERLYRRRHRRGRPDGGGSPVRTWVYSR